MTCIVGVIDKKTNKVFIGGDSAAATDSNIYTRKDVKVFKNKNFIFGCTTSFRMIQLLRFSFIPPNLNDKDIYEYMCTNFIDSIRECFKNGGYLQKYTDGDEKGGTFLVGYKNRLFKIESDFQVGENINDFDACGCGQDIALGAMFALNDSKLTIKQKIIKSLEASEFFSTGVRRPFIIINT